MELEAYLKRRFQYESFRPGQKETIQSILAQKDTIAMLPTGTGKSLCYQLPGYLLKGQVLIVSPLLSLMQDQVEQMMLMGEKNAVALNSFLTPVQKLQVLSDLKKYKFVFISPEMMGIEAITEKLKKMEISLFVIDEAHCISQWGYDFRPDYLKLGSVRKKLGNPLTLALTATATAEVREDIARHLELKNWEEVIYSVDRPEISISVEQLDGSHSKLKRTIELVKYLHGPGIIYFSSKKVAEHTASILREKGAGKVMAYHGGLDQESRILIQQQFIHGQLDVVCATSAFGMGINKSNIRYIIHYHMPMQMESYLQEIGRAARDGKESIAILLYAPGDEQLALQLAEGELPDEAQIDRLFSWAAENGRGIHTISGHEEELRQLCGFTEIQWRIARDVLDGLHAPGIEETKRSFTSFISDRLEVKRSKIFKMLQWIHFSGCKRQFILEYFGDKVQGMTQNCCSSCGIDTRRFKDTGLTEQKKDSGPDWKKQLALLLKNE
ncbi:RecQ family ATP-dependent DNA helicase [Bacillus sp. T33-2]|uniref:RecQ family ATP-dependent DNA helicase n=1 Tax=Bacillus sp. T33-2 TaxID=2054168 RepID=UPI000C78538F|nr:RecQ family ATP-dependent DNA helicase [Bacillus sp. T33-2]PLR99782.1 ATP-dependent DNA helicase [Bacillus sp. T33-2]